MKLNKNQKGKPNVRLTNIHLMRSNNDGFQRITSLFILSCWGLQFII